MKKSMGLLATVCGVWMLWSGLNPKPTESAAVVPPQMAVDKGSMEKQEEKAFVKDTSGKDKVDESGEVSRLEEQMADVAHQLKTLGFPEVFLDERLSDEERGRLISLLNLQSDLRNQLFEKRSAQIERRYQRESGAL